MKHSLSLQQAVTFALLIANAVVWYNIVERVTQ